MSTLYMAKIIRPGVETSIGLSSWADIIVDTAHQLARIPPAELDATVATILMQVLPALPEGTDFQLTIGKIELVITDDQPQEAPMN